MIYMKPKIINGYARHIDSRKLIYGLLTDSRKVWVTIRAVLQVEIVVCSEKEVQTVLR
jgi:hypothetical protein